MKSPKEIKKVTLLGSGNVATILGKSLIKKDISIVEVFSQNIDNAKSLSKLTDSKYSSSIAEVSTDSDLYIISVPDDRIKEIVDSMPKVAGIVAHTSGSQPISILERFENPGVFYPLQTITKESKPDISSIPFCIEAFDDTTQSLLEKLAKKLTNNVVNLNSEQRQYLHMTAVIVNNFTNFMYGMAHELLEDKGIDFTLLLPLIQETAQKVQFNKPHHTQTGPARRKDELTIKRHLELLEKHPEYKKIYRLLSEQLIKKYHE